MTSLANWIAEVVAAPVAGGVAIVALLSLLERLRPATSCPPGGILFNLFYLAPFHWLHAISVPAAAGAAVAATNALGGGLVELPSSGWGLLWGAALSVFVMDFGEYLFHRAQHRFPSLWAMHALHHSDLAVNASTTQRHFWAEQAIKSLTIYLAAGILLRSNERIAVIYGLIGLWNYVAHMNLRLGFGPAWFLLNSPQFHRVHHSRRREHYDRNFAALFPVFDAVFGTAHAPAPDEYPETGLEDHDAPRSLGEAALWPVRGWLRRESALTERARGS